MPYNQDQKRNLFSQDDPFETTYGGEIDVGIQPMPEGIRTSWQIQAKANWDSGELLGTILKTFRDLSD